MIAAFFVSGGAPIGGWTSYPPLSALGEIAGPGQGAGETLWIVGLAIFCGASLMGALNFITTLIDLRAKGMTLGRLPLTCWTWFVTAILGLLAFGVLLAACILLLLDRLAGTSFFIPGGLVVTDQVITWHKGGSPLLWQHLFWFFGHPEVYIAILPGMGVASHSALDVLAQAGVRLPCDGRRGLRHRFPRLLRVGPSHVYQRDEPVLGVRLFDPDDDHRRALGDQDVQLAGTLWGGKIQFNCAMLFALGFVSLFVSGGLSGLFLAQPSLDLYLHDGYFVVAHFHLIMGVAAIFGMFAGLYFWFPKMFGRFLNEGIGKVHFWLTFIGVYCIFMPMHFLGLAGTSAALFDTTAVEYLAEAAAGACVYQHRGVYHDRRAAPLPVQFLLEPVRGEGSQGRESVARDDARVVDPVAAAA
jgi:cytochrome c oxidase subunit 1